MLQKLSVPPFLVAVFLFLAGVAISQGPQKDSPNTDPNRPVYKLKIKPRVEPVPALRFTLYPELRDQVFGNAVQGYYRAFSPEWTRYRMDKDYSAKQEKWLSVPLGEFNEKEVNTPRGMLDQIRESSRKSHCDWDMIPNLKRDGFKMLLPDMQGMREFARALAIDCRVELKKGNIDKAIEDIKAGFTMAHHLGEGPTMIQGLIAVAVGSTMIPRLEEVIVQEKAPNLYWALTSLPKPLVDFSNSFSGESGITDHLFPGLRDMLYSGKFRALSPEEIQAIFLRWREMQDSGALLADKKQSVLESLGAAAFQVGLMANLLPSKKMLMENGIPEESLANLPTTQVFFLAEMLYYDKTFQNMTKWRNIPYHQSRPHILAAAEEMKKAKPPSVSPIPLGAMTGLLVPAIQKVMEVGPRLERRIAALRVIEALRLQAAKDKAWPDSLAKVTMVPVPEDPFTGKAFQFKKEGNLATIIAPTPEGEKPNQGNNFTYELLLEN